MSFSSTIVVLLIAVSRVLALPQSITGLSRVSSAYSNSHRMYSISIVVFENINEVYSVGPLPFSHWIKVSVETAFVALTSVRKLIPS